MNGTPAEWQEKLAETQGENICGDGKPCEKIGRERFSWIFS
jgi:hypothetical protein